MTQVDFYLTSDDAPQAREQLACRLASKAYGLGHGIYIHAASEQQAQLLDDQLWTLQAHSFIPHERYAAGGENSAPVVIGHQDNPDVTRDVLINLTQDVPLFFSRFLRVAEVVDKDEQRRAMARERFRFYRERGYPLQTHELTR